MIQHVALVLHAQGLRPQEKMLLVAVCNHTGEDGRIFASEQYLMRECGMSRTSFQKWRSQLVERNLLFSKRRGRRGGGRTSSHTWVNLDLLRSMHNPWFDDRDTEPTDDVENPFSQVRGNGPADGAEGAEGRSKGSAEGAKGGGKGSADGAINGPAEGADQAPPTEPVNLPKPQIESSPPPSRSSAAPSGGRTAAQGRKKKPTKDKTRVPTPSERVEAAVADAATRLGCATDEARSVVELVQTQSPSEIVQIDTYIAGRPESRLEEDLRAVRRKAAEDRRSRWKRLPRCTHHHQQLPCHECRVNYRTVDPDPVRALLAEMGPDLRPDLVQVVALTSPVDIERNTYRE